MSEKDDELALKVLSDFLIGVEELAAHALEQIGVMKVDYNPDVLNWVEAEGSKGPYQRCNYIDDMNFHALMKDLDKHKGTLTLDGWFYWSFSRGDAVGRKRSNQAKK